MLYTKGADSIIEKLLDQDQ